MLAAQSSTFIKGHIIAYFERITVRFVNYSIIKLSKNRGGEERKRRTGIRERGGGRKVRSLEQLSCSQRWVSRSKQNVAFRCIPSSAYLMVWGEPPGLAGTGPGALQVLVGQD